MSPVRKAADDSASCQAVRDAIEQDASTWRDVAELTGLSHEWSRSSECEWTSARKTASPAEAGSQAAVEFAAHRRAMLGTGGSEWSANFRVRRADAVLDVARENQDRGLWSSVSGSVPRERAPLFLSTPPRQEAVVDRRSPPSSVLAGLPWRPVLSSSVVHDPAHFEVVTPTETSRRVPGNRVHSRRHRGCSPGARTGTRGISTRRCMTARAAVCASGASPVRSRRAMGNDVSVELVRVTR
jgi:hypothetical protein